MSIEKLRREVELQEQRVAALREKKTRRLAVLSQVRAIMNASGLASFTALSNSLWELLRDLATAPPIVDNDGLPASASASCCGSADLFSEEMEERIMQEEEPQFSEEWSFEGDTGRRARRNRRRKKCRRAQGSGEGAHEGSTVDEDPARRALLAAVEALQLHNTPQRKLGVPEWLTDGETDGRDESRSYGENVCSVNGGEGKCDYSDDFDELSDSEVTPATC